MIRSSKGNNFKKGLMSNQIMVFDRGIYFADSTLIISTCIMKQLEASSLLFLGMLFRGNFSSTYGNLFSVRFAYFEYEMKSHKE